MRTGVPIRTTVVWVCLMGATCLTWLLGTGRLSVNHESLQVLVALALLIAFLKIYFIGGEFMELRGAPTQLRVAFTVWVLGVAATATGLYLVR
jgi:hypothetical protein